MRVIDDITIVEYSVIGAKGMRYQDERYTEMSREELLELEAEIHDSEYQDARVFGDENDEISPRRFWQVNRRPYRREAYIRGYRKRRLFKLMDLDHIAGQHILDVGCGIGQHSVLCALSGAMVTGIDISEAAIARAHKVAEVNDVSDRCSFSVRSVDALPYEDESFNIVLCNAVLHHIWKYDNALEELYRVLVPGGRLYFAEGVRSNPFYRKVRDLKRSLTGEQVKGDVDLELRDLVDYSDNFDEFYIEFYTLFSGIKNLIARDYGSPPLVRAVLWITEWLDEVVLRVPSLRHFALEVVGYMEKGE